MCEGITLCLSGEARAEAATALKVRLIQLGHRAEIINQRLAERIGSAESRTLVCELLTRNGVVVLVTTDEVSPPPDRRLTMRVETYDTTDFAAEKALDLLAEAAVIRLDAGSYSQEEEELVRRRLADLGYVE